MRIRSTKPEFWRSERIASVGWDARLVLKGLESYVDDNGVGKDDLALIVADVFPRDLSRNPPGTLQKVSEAISALAEAGLVWRYEDNGTRLIFISFWENVQRIEKPSKGRFPRPDGSMEYRDSCIREALPEHSRNPPESLRPGTGEQGNRGTGEEQPPSAEPRVRSKYPAEFDEFWIHYPRKVGKDDALKAWLQVRRKTPPAEIVAGVRRMAADPNLPEERFIPHPATWLRRGGWDDAPFPPRNGSRASPPSTTDQRVQAGLDLARRYADQERLELGA